MLAYFEQGGALTSSAGVPKKLPKGVTRSILIVKPEAKKVENPNLDLLFNDVGGGEPFEYLQRVLCVYIPVLTNPAAGLGEVASTELSSRLQSFLSTVSTTVGHLKGETCLPLPPLDPASTAALSAKDRIHLLESCVATWTKQIKAVLRMDPEASLRAGGHPTPDAELSFWRSKAAHLDAVFDQLQTDRVRRVLQYMDASASTFCEPFAKLCKEVFAARGEAKDNAKFLATLEPYVDLLNNGSDFGELAGAFRPAMHTLLLIWKHSKFYCTPSRMVVLVRQMVNSVIAAAGRFLTGRQAMETLMDEAASSVVPKLKTLLRVAGEFKRVYFKYKALAATECPTKPWRISNAALFSRLDAFLERLHDVADFANVILTFNHLEKVVIGGSKGKILTTTVEGIFSDFKAAVKKMEEVPYDLLDADDPAFGADFAVFKGRVAVLERRLSNILVAAFDDAPNLYARFKLLDTYHLLLERPLIADELEKLHIALVKEFAVDLRRVQELFLSERAAPPIPWNLPPIAGALTWSRSLRDRIQDPMARINGLSREILAREESREMVKLFAAIMGALDAFDAERVAAWGSDMERNSDEKLRLPLLRHKADEVGFGAAAGGGGGGGEGGGAANAEEGKEDDAAGAAATPVKAAAMLDVNFDPSLVCLLREVKYFLLLGLEVPASALDIYKRAEMYRRFTGALDLMVGMHNTILSEILPVEVPLLKAHLGKMEVVLAKGLKDLNWKSPAVEGFIADATASVKVTYDMLYTLKSNLRDIVAEMENWSREPLLVRKSKPSTVEEFENAYKVTRTARYAAIQEGGKAVLKKLKETEVSLKLPKGNKDWTVYVDFVNGIVVQGLSKLVRASLRKLLDLLSPEKIKKNMELPLIVIELALPGGKSLKYRPDVHEALLEPGAPPPTKANETLYDIVNGWVESFYHAARTFKRLDDNEGRYVKEMMDDPSVQMLLAQLQESVARAEVTAVEFREKFARYSSLWSKDMAAELADFCAANYFELPKTDEQLKAEAEANGEAPPPQPRVPDLAKFEAEITRFREIGEVVQGIKTPTDLGWLRINSQPVKTALGAMVAAWGSTFAEHVADYVVGAVNDLAAFVTNTVDGTNVEVTEENPGPLKSVMKVLMEARKTSFHRKAIVAPLRSAVALLKRAGVALDERRVEGVGAKSGLSIIEYIDQADLLLDAAIKKTYSKKEQIYPLQNAEMENIKKQAQAFDDSVRTFWNGFRKNAPYTFSGSVDEAYAQLNAYFVDLMAIEKGLVDLNEVENLFELPISRFNETAQCRVQLKLLKTMWDFKGFVLSTYDAWKLALWSDINTELLEDSNKKMAAELKRVGDTGPMVKAWGVFKDVEVMVRDMAITLPLINELHSPSMRPRHWAQLANACAVRALDPSDSKFCLDDMLSLKLHTHAEESSEIVDTANKEQKIEKKMDEIEAAWKAFALDFVPHKDMDLKVVKASDEVMEALDAHQMELQGIVGMGKVLDFFRARVETAQKNLGCVEEVLKEWLSVTRNWAALEAIFLASADIRAQLPDDTKRFEGIDAGFKELMKAAVDTPNVVESCTKEGRGESLKEMSKNLELCQRSLNEYLDMKKKIFPRFYFVSNVALLDILSNGNNPPKIMPYTGDCALEKRRSRARAPAPAPTRPQRDSL